MSKPDATAIEKQIVELLEPLTLDERLHVLSRLAVRFAPQAAFTRGLPDPVEGEPDPLAHLRKKETH